MKQKRKGLIKPRHNSFHKEYSFEIRVILLFTLGIFLLVEDLEIKQYIFEAIRTIKKGEEITCDYTEYSDFANVEKPSKSWYNCS